MQRVTGKGGRKGRRKEEKKMKFGAEFTMQNLPAKHNANQSRSRSLHVEYILTTFPTQQKP